MFMEPGEPTRPRDPGDPGTIAPKVIIGPLALYMAFCGFIRYRWDIHSEDYDGLWDINIYIYKYIYISYWDILG